MAVQLLAVDEAGGQAILEQNGIWYRVAADNGWEASQLRGPSDAFRCCESGLYFSEQETFKTIDDAVQNMRQRYVMTRRRVRPIPLRAVIHHCPIEILSRHKGQASSEAALELPLPVPNRENLVAVEMESSLAFSSRKPFRSDRDSLIGWFLRRVKGISLRHHRAQPQLDSDDVAQEAILQLLRTLRLWPAFERRLTVLALDRYFSVLVSHIATDRMRLFGADKRELVETLATEPRLIEDPHPGPYELAVRAEELNDLRMCLQKLRSESQRDSDDVDAVERLMGVRQAHRTKLSMNYYAKTRVLRRLRKMMAELGHQISDDPR